MNNLLQYFKEIVIKNHFRISSQELLKDCVFGIDGINRKLLIVTNQNELFCSSVINLDEIKKCSIKKEYRSIEADGLKSKRLEHYLEKILLRLEFGNGRKDTEVLFYQDSSNPLYEVHKLTNKARLWETMLSKMRSSSQRITAKK